jgi:bromodomain-containing protein 7/9
VISNAKTFNPPGTIYHTEAERIEAWASDHISKASSCVIEYETEWNIDVDRDEDVNVDADEDAAGGAGSGPGRTGSVGPDTPARRSPSVLSASVPPTNRRGRNAAKKEGISETLDPDGHFPGFKDGVGVFPPGSDWAEVMLALKLKGAVTPFLPIVSFPSTTLITPCFCFSNAKARDIGRRRNVCAWKRAALRMPPMGV